MSIQACETTREEDRLMVVGQALDQNVFSDLDDKTFDAWVEEYHELQAIVKRQRAEREEREKADRQQQDQNRRLTALGLVRAS